MIKRKALFSNRLRMGDTANSLLVQGTGGYDFLYCEQYFSAYCPAGEKAIAFYFYPAIWGKRKPQCFYMTPETARRFYRALNRLADDAEANTPGRIDDPVSLQLLWLNKVIPEGDNKEFLLPIYTISLYYSPKELKRDIAKHTPKHASANIIFLPEDFKRFINTFEGTFDLTDAQEEPNA